MIVFMYLQITTLTFVQGQRSWPVSSKIHHKNRLIWNWQDNICSSSIFFFGHLSRSFKTWHDHIGWLNPIQKSIWYILQTRKGLRSVKFGSFQTLFRECYIIIFAGIWFLGSRELISSECHYGTLDHFKISFKSKKRRCPIVKKIKLVKKQVKHWKTN